MKFESEEEKQAVETLCDVAQQAWDKGSYCQGEWPALEKALLLLDPLIHPGFDIRDFLGYDEE